jgi:ABC-type sugar transport system substrate-binding protein
MSIPKTGFPLLVMNGSAILANNDEMALGAIEALEAAKIKDKIM